MISWKCDYKRRNLKKSKKASEKLNFEQIFKIFWEKFISLKYETFKQRIWFQIFISAEI